MFRLMECPDLIVKLNLVVWKSTCEWMQNYVQVCGAFK